MWFTIVVEIEYLLFNCKRNLSRNLEQSTYLPTPTEQIWMQAVKRFSDI